jgi:hypothetical protein
MPICVAVGAGQMLVSGDPTGGSEAWKVEPIDAGRTLTGISCVLPSLCVAVDDHGHVLSSTEPANGAGAWKIADVDGEVPLAGVSCASASLCVAFDANGNVLVSTEPQGGPATWRSTHVGVSAHDISCVSTPLCVATSGNEVVSSSDPAGGAGAWQTASVPYVDGGVSCAAPSLCVAFSRSTNEGITASADPTAGAQAWMRSEGVGARSLSAISCASTALCVAAEGEQVLLGTATNELSVSLAGSGEGRVQSSPIACPWSTCSHAPPGILEPLPITELVCEDVIFLAPGPLCQFAFPPGDQTTLTAVPAAGEVFAGWGGDCSGDGASCVVTMNSAESVTATFEPASPPTHSTTPTPAPPRLTDVHESAKRWREGSARAQISRAQGGPHRRKRLPTGTVFTFALNEPASVTLAFTREPGHAGRRRLRHECSPIEVTQAKASRDSACVRPTVVTLTGPAHSGVNRVRFEGPLAPHKRLKPGAYTVELTATAVGVHTAPSTLHFTIVAG